MAGAEDRSPHVARLLRPERDQVRFVPASLDSLIADDHPVRGMPNEHLVDGGFPNIAAIRIATRRGCTIYAPEAKPRGGREPGEPVPGDAVEVAEWRRRMQTAEAKRIYRERSATIECTNGLARNRGLLQFLVRGIPRVRAVATLYAVAHNILRSLTLPGSGNAGLASG